MLRQFALYLVFGGLAAAVNVGMRWTLTRVGLVFWLAVAVAYVAGMGVNFFLNKHLNFKSFERRTVDQAGTFAIVALGGLVLTELLSQAGLRLFSAVALPVPAEDAAHVTAVGSVVVYSFLAHRYLTFRRGIRAALRRPGKSE